MAETFVLDCSVAAKWVLSEQDRPVAMEWLDRHNSGEILLIAPDLLLAELATLLAKRSRRKQMSPVQALAAYAFVLESSIALFNVRPLLLGALDLSLRHHMSFWDCVYLALALEQDCPMLTADRRLFRAGRSRHPLIQLMSERG
jgi:predicted nucleic acid-binding protein